MLKLWCFLYCLETLLIKVVTETTLLDWQRNENNMQKHKNRSYDNNLKKTIVWTTKPIDSFNTTQRWDSNPHHKRLPKKTEIYNFQKVEDMKQIRYNSRSNARKISLCECSASMLLSSWFQSLANYSTYCIIHHASVQNPTNITSILVWTWLLFSL
jgi:hypothetical protein